MLEKLGFTGAHIFEVELSEDKTIVTLMEACDLYYEIDLTKNEFLELINDLTQIAEQMK